MIVETKVVGISALQDAPTYLADATIKAGALSDTTADPDRIKTVGVLGAGAMGRGIAMAFAQSGRQVAMVDPSPDALAAAQTHMAGLAARMLKKARLDQAEHDALLQRFSYGATVDIFAAADLVVEVVPEIMALKQKVLGEIEAVTGAKTLITTNTSTLDVDEIAKGLKDPARFLGTHFFIPAQVNKLLEVIPATATSDATLSMVMALASAIGKQPVIAPNGDGFIGNRLFDRFHQEAMYLVEEGALPEDVDRALEKWGMAIGPLRALDLVGNDIPWGVRKQRANRANPPFQPRIGDALCEAELYGQKVGRGWYLYDQATPKGRPYEHVQGLIHRVSANLGLTRRRIDRSEIIGRCITALMVEGLAMLAEGRAARASDIDMVYVIGYGFPAAFGGPMRLLQEIGEAEVLTLAQHYAEISGRGDTAWAMPASLKTTEVAE